MRTPRWPDDDLFLLVQRLQRPYQALQRDVL
jgi:hypothetical protein